MLISVIRLGECIDIGPGVARVFLEGIKPLRKIVDLRIESPSMSMTMELREGAFFSITDKVGIELRQCKKSRVIFGVVAPREIKIERMAKSEDQKLTEKA